MTALGLKRDGTHDLSRALTQVSGVYNTIRGTNYMQYGFLWQEYPTE